MLLHLAKRFVSTLKPRPLLKRVPRALEGGLSERQHLLGAGREDSEWGEGLPKVRCRRTSRFGHLCNPVIYCLWLLFAQRVSCQIQLVDVCLEKRRVS